MKKILSVLILLFLFVGCTDKTPSVPKNAMPSKTACDWGYFVFPGTDWGITEDEVFKGIKQEKSSFTLEEQTQDILGELKSIERTYQKTMNFLDDNVIVSFNFYNSAPSPSPRLTSVNFAYQSKMTREKFDAICEKLLKMISDQNIPIEELMVIEKDDNGNTVAIIRSASTFRDLPKEVRIKYSEGLAYQQSKFVDNGADRIRMSDDPLGGMTSPLSTLTMTLVADEQTGEMNCYATISGNKNCYLNVINLKSDIGE